MSREGLKKKRCQKIGIPWDTKRQGGQRGQRKAAEKTCQETAMTSGKTLERRVSRVSRLGLHSSQEGLARYGKIQRRFRDVKGRIKRIWHQTRMPRERKMKEKEFQELRQSTAETTKQSCNHASFL